MWSELFIVYRPQLLVLIKTIIIREDRAKSVPRDIAGESCTWFEIFGDLWNSILSVDVSVARFYFRCSNTISV